MSRGTASHGGKVIQEDFCMKEFFEEYGSVIVAVIAVVGLVAVVYYLVGSGKGSVISDAINGWLTKLTTGAGKKIDNVDKITDGTKTSFMALSMLF